MPRPVRSLLIAADLDPSGGCGCVCLDGNYSCATSMTTCSSSTVPFCTNNWLPRWRYAN